MKLIQDLIALEARHILLEKRWLKQFKIHFDTLKMKASKLIFVLFLVCQMSCHHNTADPVSSEKEGLHQEMMFLAARASHLAACIRSGHANDFRTQLLMDSLFRIYLVDPDFIVSGGLKTEITKDMLEKSYDPLMWNDFFDQGFALRNKEEFLFIDEPRSGLVIDAARINRKIHSAFDSKEDYLEAVKNFRSRITKCCVHKEATKE